MRELSYVDKILMRTYKFYKEYESYYIRHSLHGEEKWIFGLEIFNTLYTPLDFASYIIEDDEGFKYMGIPIEIDEVNPDTIRLIIEIKVR